MLSFDIIQIKQIDETRRIVVCSIPFPTLMGIAVFTKRKTVTTNLFEDVIGKPKYESNHYQRMVNEERTKKIYSFILKEINLHVKGGSSSIALFPTSMILATDLYEGGSLEDYEKEEDVGVFIDGSKLYINKECSSLIIDGQHRLAGMNELYKAAISDDIRVGRKVLDEIYPNLSGKLIASFLSVFQFQCTIVLNYDLWEQGKVFANVNFNQKPVNKSIYYDIFGAYPETDKNEIFLAHHLIIYLNKNSEIKGMVKMHGTGPGYFSQAFFVEAILPLFKKGNIWENIPFDYLAGGKKHNILPVYFSAFFKALHSYYENFWPNVNLPSSRYEYGLIKTTGLAPLIALNQFLYPIVKEELKFDEENIKVSDEKTQEKIKDAIVDIFKKQFTVENLTKQANLWKSILESRKDPMANEKYKDDILKIKQKISGEYYFGITSKYKGATGKSAQSNLFKEIAFDLGFISSKQ
jgi:DGQHR domain-containing protein